MTTPSTAPFRGAAAAVSVALSAALALTALVAGPTAADAQQSLDGPWLALAGCWVEMGAPAGAPMTCVVPADGGATFLTVGSEGVADRYAVRADGVERTLDAGGCAGVQAAELSRTGERVFTRSRLSCEGGTERATRGLITMVASDEWIQVRALTVGEGSVSWVTRYRPAPASRVEAAGLTDLEAATRDRRMAIETARMATSSAPTVDDIIEAHARTDPEAVRAWIAEQGAPMRVDADRLVRLADAGVSEAVIDMVVAMSYPERFDVAREPQRRALERGDRDRYDRYRHGYGRYGSPYLYDPFYYGYYGYSPYRYSSWRYGHYGSPTVIVVRPAGGQQGSGRAVNGRGYSSGGGDASSRSGSGSSSNVSRPAPSSRSGAARAGSGYRGSSASSPSSSSSSSKGKAKPRGGG